MYMKDKPTVGSAFSGIGGMDLAFAAAGFDIRWQIEINPFCQRILTKHKVKYWPNARLYDDIKTARDLEKVDVIIGGFPCQDVSNAGKKKGIKEGTRSGLWIELARLIGEVRPAFVLLENVAAITSRDGTRVIADLTALGYDAEWGIIPAATVGAPHERKRWWAVAYSDGAGCNTFGSESEIRQGRLSTFRNGSAMYASPTAPIESRLGRIFDGIPARLDRSRRRSVWPGGPFIDQRLWEPPRTTARRKNRKDRIQALGNAVVPQAVYPFAEAIREFMES